MARAYLHPVKGRSNLEVRPAVLVTRVVFEHGRAVGVEYVHRGRRRASERRRGGPAAAGPSTLRNCSSSAAWATPESWKRSASNRWTDLPGVGENLQDHLEVYIQHACKKPVSIAPAFKWWNRPRVAVEWAMGRKGLGATNHFEGGGFARSNDDVDYPNLMFHFLPIAIRYDGSAPTPGHGYQIHVGPMYSDARGSVKLRSTDPTAHPAIRFNYLSTARDRREWVEAVRLGRRLLSQPAMEEFNGGEISPGPEVATDEDILAWVSRDSETALHPSCTCKMGTGPDAVVDPGTMRAWAWTA